MERAKIALSAEELRLVTDSSVIFMKNAIISKVYDLFGELSSKDVLRFQLPREVSAIPPKIARGEAYKGLPYVMLDYPRYFTSTDVLALRTFFWWGRYMSVTLHLKGMYKERFAHRALTVASTVPSETWYSSSTGDEWDHDLKGGGYRNLSHYDLTSTDHAFSEGTFLKISCFRRLDQWDTLPEWLDEVHRAIGQQLRE